MLKMMMMITIDCKLGSFSEIFVGAKSWFQQGGVCAAFKVHLAGNYYADGEDASGDGDAEHASGEDDGEEVDCCENDGRDVGIQGAASVLEELNFEESDRGYPTELVRAA